MPEPSQESLTEAWKLLDEPSNPCTRYYIGPYIQVLATALDEHKAKMCEVSVIADDLIDQCGEHIPYGLKGRVEALILPKPPVDPLLEAWEEAINQPAWISKFDTFRGALAKRNARIVFDAPDKPDAATERVWGVYESYYAEDGE